MRTRNSIVNQIAAQEHISKASVNRILNMLANMIGQDLQEDKVANLPGIGHFVMITQSGRDYTLPDGTICHKESKRKPKFKTSKRLMKRIQE